MFTSLSLSLSPVKHHHMSMGNVLTGGSIESKTVYRLHNQSKWVMILLLTKGTDLQLGDFPVKKQRYFRLIVDIHATRGEIEKMTKDEERPEIVFEHKTPSLVVNSLKDRSVHSAQS